MLEFIDKILNTLKDNGFPDKKVSLPTEKMYEAADNRGLSFNKVLEQMKQTIEIDVDITDEKIFFSSKKPAASANSADFAGLNQNDMFKKAQEMLSKMDPAEVQKMQDMILNMSDEEREEMMQKGKDLGLI